MRASLAGGARAALYCLSLSLSMLHSLCPCPMLRQRRRRQRRCRHQPRHTRHHCVSSPTLRPPLSRALAQPPAITRSAALCALAKRALSPRCSREQQRRLASLMSSDFVRSFAHAQGDLINGPLSLTLSPSIKLAG